ncbi:MAG: MFS transporter [Rhodospirillaceae bacterium]|nr:MFS transporter [Rhodospirillaceae bacterium]
MSASPAAAAAATYPSPRRAWYALSIIAFGYIFAFLDRSVVGLIAPDITADFGLTDTQMGLLQGLAFALLYTLFGLPLGWYVDRFNRKWIFAGGMALWSGMTALCGTATSFMQLFIYRLGVGVGESTLNPCSSSLISDLFPPEKRARAFAFYTMATAFAGLSTALIVGVVLAALRDTPTVNVPLLGELKKWQVVFLAVGLPGLIPAFLLAFTVAEPKRMGLAAKVKGRATWGETRAFIGSNKIALGFTLLAAALVILEIYAAAYWHPTIMLRLFGWSPLQTVMTLNLFGAMCGIVSAYTSANLTNYFKRRGHPEAVLFTIMVGVIGCTILGAAGPLMPTAELAAVTLIAKSFFVNYPPAAAITAINEVTPNEHRGLTTALYVILTGLVAQGIGPVSVGFTTDAVFQDPKAIGLSLSLVVLATGVIAAVLLLYARPAYRRAVANVTWERPAPAAAGH